MDPLNTEKVIATNNSKPVFTIDKIEEMNLKSRASYLGNPTSKTSGDSRTIMVGTVENKEILPRTITVFGFSLGTAHEFMERVHRYYTEDPETPILILVMSYGGDVDGLMGMVGTIDTYPTMEFRTLVSGTSMSCGAALLSAGTKGKRYALPHARIMVHKVSSGNWGNTDDNTNEAKETARINDELFSILAKNSKHSAEAWMKTLTNLDGAREFYLSAEDALENGIIDFIVTDLTEVIPMAPMEENPPNEIGPSQEDGPVEGGGE